MRALLLVLMVAGAAHADAMPDDAKARYDSGLALFQQRKYEDAIGEFRAAYDRAPRREILFPWAQAERLSGDCPSAVVLYRKFLTLDPTVSERAAAELNLKRCESALSTHPDEVQPPRPLENPVAPVIEPPAAPPPEPLAPPPPPRPWQRDPAFLGLLSVGVVGLAGGIALAGASASVASDAGHAASYHQYADRIELAGTLRIAGFVCIGAGAALALAGAIRGAIVYRRHRALQAQAMFGPGAAFLSLSTSY